MANLTKKVEILKLEKLRFSIFLYSSILQPDNDTQEI